MQTIKIDGDKCKLSFDSVSKRHYIHGKSFSEFGYSLEEAIEKYKLTKNKKDERSSASL